MDIDISNLSAILPFIPAAVNTVFGVHRKIKARLDGLKETLRPRPLAEAARQQEATPVRLEDSVETKPVQVSKRGTTTTQSQRPRSTSKASKEVLKLQGYDFDRRSYVDFDILVKDFPRNILVKYTWREGSEDECAFEGIAVNGYRLAMLTEDDLSQEES